MRTDNTLMMNLVHGLSSIEIDWMGVNAKKYSIARIGNMKIGYLAFCSLSRCTDAELLPYSPIRYSPKVSRESVQDLKKVPFFYSDVHMYYCHYNFYCSMVLILLL